MDREKLMNTATRSGRHVGIIETARAAIERGIDPRSEQMVNLIRAAFPAANQHEAEAAAEFAAKTRSFRNVGICRSTSMVFPVG